MPHYLSLFPVWRPVQVERKFSRDHERAGEAYEATLHEIAEWRVVARIQANSAAEALEKARRPWNPSPIIEEDPHATLSHSVH